MRSAFSSERQVGGKEVISEIQHETDDVDALYYQFLARFAWVRPAAAAKGVHKVSDAVAKSVLRGLA